MADFCKQCSTDMFGKDFRELADLVTMEQVAASYYAVALCEGCGFIAVNHDGVCIDPTCKLHGE